MGGDVQEFGVVGAGGYFALGDDAQVGVFVELAADDGPGAGGRAQAILRRDIGDAGGGAVAVGGADGFDGQGEAGV